MKTLKQTSRLCLIALAVATTAPALAISNADFDARAFAQIGAMQQQNANSIAAIRQQHLQQNYPRLVAGYRQYLASGQRGSFEQFAYWDLMSAAGTNPEGALTAQRNQYEANRVAHGTVTSAYDSYRAGMYNNSARTSAAANNYSTGAIRGQAGYVDRNSGANTMLPYYSPAGQVINNGGNYYVQDGQGTYYQLNNNHWTRMNAR